VTLSLPTRPQYQTHPVSIGTAYIDSMYNILLNYKTYYCIFKNTFNEISLS